MLKTQRRPAKNPDGVVVSLDSGGYEDWLDRLSLDYQYSTYVTRYSGRYLPRANKLREARRGWCLQSAKPARKRTVRTDSFLPVLPESRHGPLGTPSKIDDCLLLNQPPCFSSLHRHTSHTTIVGSMQDETVRITKHCCWLLMVKERTLNSFLARRGVDGPSGL